jgi:hypothetical protein
MAEPIRELRVRVRYDVQPEGRAFSWVLSGAFGFLVGLLAILLMGCGHLDTAKAMSAVETAAVALDVIVEDRAEKWAARASGEVDRCEAEGMTAGQSCVDAGEPDCGLLAQKTFDVCMAPLVSDANKAGVALERLITAQRALMGLRAAVEAIDEVTK